MHPPPSVAPDEQQALLALRTVALQIGDAVAQADVKRVQELSLLRHHLLQQACGPDGPVHFSDSQRAELIRESEAWIDAMLAHQARITSELGRLRTQRNTRRILTRTYRSAPSTTAQCFAHQG